MIIKISTDAFTTRSLIGHSIRASSAFVSSRKDPDLLETFLDSFLMDLFIFLLFPVFFTIIKPFRHSTLTLLMQSPLTIKVAGPVGFEPTTLGFGDRCSTNWSYGPIIFKISA